MARELPRVQHRWPRAPGVLPRYQELTQEDGGQTHYCPRPQCPFWHQGGLTLVDLFQCKIKHGCQPLRIRRMSKDYTGLLDST